MKKIATYFCFAVLLCLISFGFKPTRASAAVLGTGSFPATLHNTIWCYDSTSGDPNKYQVGSWISPNGQPTTLGSITVPAGTTQVNLQLNQWYFVYHELTGQSPTTPGPYCQPPPAVPPVSPLPTDKAPGSLPLRQATTYVTASKATRVGSATPYGTLTGMVPNVTHWSVNRSTSSRYWFNDPANTAFRWNAPAPLTTSTTIQVVITEKIVNTFFSGGRLVYQCVNPRPPAVFVSGPTDYKPCTATDFVAVIRVNVTSQPPNTQVTSSSGNCSVISGWSIDKDAPTAKVQVSLYINAPGSSGGTLVTPAPGRVNANSATPVIPTPYPWAGFPPAEAAGHGFNLSIAGLVPPGSTKNFYISTYGIDSAGNRESFAQEIGPIRIRCPGPTISCGPTTTTPSVPEASTSMTIVAGVTSTFTSNYSGSYSVNVSGPSGSSSAGSGTVNIPAKGSAQTPSLPYTPPVAGTYTVTTRWIANGVTINCTQNFTAVYKPYLRVYGGDVVAGIESTVCSGWGAGSGGSIYGTGDGVHGTIGQLALFAVGNSMTINNFGSGGLLGKGASFLDFANSPSNGGFTGSQSPICPPDYISQVNSACIEQGLDYRGVATPPAPNLVKPGSRDYCYSANPLNGIQPASPQITVAKGVHVRILVGNGFGAGVGVRRNIKFSNVTSTNIDDFPSLQIVTTGTLELDPSVTEIDGMYISQGSPFSAAVFRDCYFSGYSDAQLYSRCNKQLEIKGGVVAQRALFLRTYGSLADSTGAGEVSDGSGNASGCKNSGGSQVSGNCAAEVVNFSPAMYLNIGPATDNLQSITSLPPIL